MDESEGNCLRDERAVVGIGTALVSGYLSFRTVNVSNPNIETLLMEYDGYKYLLAANNDRVLYSGT